MLTTCPACLTRFRIHAADLKPRRGLVRCSACRVVFDARDMMQAEAGDPAPEAFLLDAMAPIVPPVLTAPAAAPSPRAQPIIRPPRLATPWLVWAVPVLAVLLVVQIVWMLRPASVPDSPFRVEFSALERWPGDALRLRVSFSNRATEPQPWPAFDLRVTEEASGGHATRRIIAAEYREPQMPALMAPGSEHELRLLLAAAVTPDRYEIAPVIYP